jgi:replication factor A2
MQISSGNTGNSVYDQIYSVIIACKEEEGIHMAQIIQQLSGRLSEMEIKNGVDYLINDGRCYNTVDEEHVRSADNY